MVPCHTPDSGVVIRAFADDTAMTLDDTDANLPKVVYIFSEYGLISGMQIAIKKTVAPANAKKTTILRFF